MEKLFPQALGVLLGMLLRFMLPLQDLLDTDDDH